MTGSPNTLTFQRYRCLTCRTEKPLRGVSPTDGPKTLRTGCEPCGRVTRHVAAGREGPRR